VRDRGRNRAGVGQTQGEHFSLGLLGGFELERTGHAIPQMTAGSQRLLAFLALRDRPITRMAAASSLWPEVPEERALSSLRSAISRLPDPVQASVLVTPQALRLAPIVDVDLMEARELAHRLLDASGTLDASDLDSTAIAALSVDLLPDWYDDWAIAESESWHQLRLHALEAVAGQLLATGRFGAAARAAILAIQAEPLRESAHAVLMRVHLAEGNQSEALATFAQYRGLLRTELGLEPTKLLSDLLSNSRKT